MKWLAMLVLMMTMNTWATENKGTKMEIKNVIETYVEGYLNAESSLVARAFHPETILYSVDEGALDRTELASWLQNLDERKARGDIRSAEFKLENIEVTDTTARAKIKLKFAKVQFTDYLSLLLIEGKWVIIGKIYSVKGL